MSEHDLAWHPDDFVDSPPQAAEPAEAPDLQQVAWEFWAVSVHEVLALVAVIAAGWLWMALP